MSLAAIHLLALVVLRAFDPGATKSNDLVVEATGSPFSGRLFDGDELLVSRGAREDA